MRGPRPLNINTKGQDASTKSFDVFIPNCLEVWCLEIQLVRTWVTITDTLSVDVVVTRCLEVQDLVVRIVTKFTKVTNWRCLTSE